MVGHLVRVACIVVEFVATKTYGDVERKVGPQDGFEFSALFDLSLVTNHQ